MSTKLKTPITLTIENEATAVWLCCVTGYNGTVTKLLQEREPGCPVDLANQNRDDKLFLEIDNQLVNQGIHYLQWGKQKPLKIGGHQVEFTSDGAKIGCTKVSKSEIEAFIERYEKEFPKKDCPTSQSPAPEWPRYYRGNFDLKYYRTFSNADGGEMYLESGGWVKSPAQQIAIHGHPNYTAVSRNEVAAAIGYANL